MEDREKQGRLQAGKVGGRGRGEEEGGEEGEEEEKRQWFLELRFSELSALKLITDH